MSVPSIRSAPFTYITGPKTASCSILSRRTQESPRLLGRKGERVAKTPRRVLPPKRGGRTVRDSSLYLRILSSITSFIKKLPNQPNIIKVLKSSDSLSLAEWRLKNNTTRQLADESALPGNAEFRLQRRFELGYRTNFHRPQNYHFYN